MSKTNSETITNIELDKLAPFKSHPYVVRDDEQMRSLTESIRSVGVLTPIIVRPLNDMTYEIISGHRRAHACEMVGIRQVPAIIRDVDRDTSTVMMVDSNSQREKVLPSEKAKAYKMKLDAIKRQGVKLDIIVPVPVGQKSTPKTSRELIAVNSKDSATQIQRYIRLNDLIPELLEMVDAGSIGMRPAVELSYLTKDEQKLLLITIESEQATPSLSQALQMKNLSRQGRLTDDEILRIMMDKKKPECWNISIPVSRLVKYFPQTFTPKDMEETIMSLLDGWARNQTKEHRNRK